MSSVRKEKNLFIITLDNGKQSYFDFATEQYYGVSNKIVKNFSTEAKRVLENEVFLGARDCSFLSWFFLERCNRCSCYGVPDWSCKMVETIYSIFSNEYDCAELRSVAEFCHLNKYKLDSKGIKILKEAVSSLKENHNIYPSPLEREVLRATYKGYPAYFYNFLSDTHDSEIRAIMVKDAEKIIFCCEHEFWRNLPNNWGSLRNLNSVLQLYIKCCLELNKPRTYKNLFLSVCRMEEEIRLLQEKDCKAFQESLPLRFEDNNFITIIPFSAQEFRVEADYQQNCVFDFYYSKVLNERTHIVFVRKKNDPATPYITCEVTNDGKILQYLARFNTRVQDKEALAFKDAYQKHLDRYF